MRINALLLTAVLCLSVHLSVTLVSHAYAVQDVETHFALYALLDARSMCVLFYVFYVFYVSM